ncbi:MAG TPA: glutaredoxin family protein [Pseudolysinimonas sp.]
MTRLTFIGKPDCHLCEDAHAVVDEVLADFPGVELSERSILDEPELFEAYAEEIPVVLIDDRVHTIWRADAARLRSALAAAVDHTPIDSGPASS